MEMNLVVAILGLILTFTTSIVIMSFKIGHVAARVEELEKWRITIRADMHEISDQLEKVGVELSRLSTLIVERTDRRTFKRDNQRDN